MQDRAESSPVSVLVSGAGLRGGHAAVRSGMDGGQAGCAQNRTLVLCPYTSPLTPEGG